MPAVTPLVETKCPGCLTTLRIPADWAQELVRCKQCGLLSMSSALTAEPHTDFELADEPETAVAVGSGLRWKLAFVGIWLVGMAGLVGAVLWSAFHTDPVQPEQPVQVASAGPNPVAAPPEMPPEEPKPPEPMPPQPPEKPAPRPPRNPNRPRPGQPPAKPPEVPGTTGPYPRRALAINVNSYLFTNPVHPGSPGREILTILDNLFHALQIAPEQVVTLSDTGKNARPPWKPVIESTISRFLDTCRAQDRIVLVFVGHMIELEDQAYLMPIEGELTVKESLIPLTWLYEQLGRCRAGQKVLLLDVCRLDAARGPERPGAFPLGAKLAAALDNPPAGVQVWSACAAGQHSYEIQSGQTFGSAFLNQIQEAMLRFKQIVPARQRPEDQLSILELANAVNKQVPDAVKKLTGFEQTPRLAGFMAENGVAYDPAEPLPPPLAIELPPAAAPPADAALVKGILAELDVPSIKMTKEWRVPLRLEGMPPFLARDLAAYPPEAAATPLRKAVQIARETLNQTTDRQLNYQYFIEERGRPIAENVFKQRLVDEGKNVARILFPLNDALEELQKVEAGRLKEPRRWQANYDYLLARTLAQVAYLYEYQYHLGQMRKDLPPRDPALHQGWQLTTQEKMLVSERDYRNYATQSRKLLEGLIQDHPGTPWAVLARRDLMTYLGLDWKPLAGPR
jgi:hypothetical protein